MKAVDFNPFSWDNSSTKVQSSVISLELQSENGAKLNVTNLDNYIEIVIPLSSPPSKTNNKTVIEHHFLKPHKLTVRSYYAELADVPVFITLGVLGKNTSINLLVKFGSRPSTESSDLNVTVKFTSICGNMTKVVPNKSSCHLDEKIITVLPTKPTLIYIGLLLELSKTESKHAREKRSCFGQGRQRRSCVGVKDPPPKGVHQTVVPQYDPRSDVNYTFTVTQSSCLYWSEDEEKWTSDGCKVH